MPASAPAANLADLVFPADLDTMSRRDIVAFFDQHGLVRNAGQSTESLRALLCLLRDVTATIRAV